MTSVTPDMKPIQHLIFDLGAGQKSLRLAAVMQLAHFSGNPLVIKSLKKLLTQETEEEIRFFAAQAIQRHQSGRPTPVAASPCCQQSPADLTMERFFLASEEELPGLLAQLSSLSRESLQSFVAQLIKGRRNEKLLQHLLRFSDQFLDKDMDQEALNVLLRHRNPGIVLKTLHKIVATAPGKCGPSLPHLLKNPSPAVRIMGLRTLYKFWPEEALRLLREFLEAGDPAKVGMGLSLMFQFPFENVCGAVLSLIAKDLIPVGARETVRVLVALNPSPRFLHSLSLVQLRWLETTPEWVKELHLVASTALAQAMMEEGTSEEIANRYLEQAQKTFATILGETAPATTVDKAVSAANPKLSDGESPMAPSDPEKETSWGSALEAAFKRNSPDAETMRAIQEVAECGNLPYTSILQALQVIRKLSIKEEYLLEWMVNLLDHRDEKVVLKALLLLEQMSPSHLAGSLPVLCFHPSPKEFPIPSGCACIRFAWKI